MAKVKFPNGKEYNFEVLGFSEEAVELIAQQEAFGKPEFSTSKFLKVLRVCMRQSLEQAGYKPAEVETALNSIPLSVKKSQDLFAEIIGVLVDAADVQDI